MGAERRAGRTTEPQEAPVPPPERFPRAGRAGRAARGGAAEERRLGRSGPGAAGPRPPPRPGSAQDPPRASLSTTRTGTSAPSSTRPAPSRPAAHTRARGRRRTSRTSRAPLGPPASPTRGAERRSRCAPSPPRARTSPPRPAGPTSPRDAGWGRSPLLSHTRAAAPPSWCEPPARCMPGTARALPLAPPAAAEGRRRGRAKAGCVAPRCAAGACGAGARPEPAGLGCALWASARRQASGPACGVFFMCLVLGFFFFFIF